MEALVNYSSEDDQEDAGFQIRVNIPTPQGRKQLKKERIIRAHFVYTYIFITFFFLAYMGTACVSCLCCVCANARKRKIKN